MSRYLRWCAGVAALILAGMICATDAPFWGLPLAMFGGWATSEGSG